MKISQLFSCYSNFKMGSDSNREVTGLCTDSRKFVAGNVFVATRGTQFDSHLKLAEICQLKPPGVVVEDISFIPKDFNGAVLQVTDTKLAVVRLAERYYAQPTDSLFCVGVTGTNGKTSTTYLVEAIFNSFGLNTGVIGTINHHYKSHIWSSELTTPDAILLQRRMRDFVVMGAKAVAFEVSSHAIEQGRAAGVPFDCVVFTNLTRDHLDYHLTMENYFAAKSKLFSEMIATNISDRAVTAIINTDDEWGRKIEVHSRAKKWTYGEAKSDFQFQILQSDFSGTEFRLQTPRGKADFKIPLVGKHNVYNSVAAIATSVAAGASLETCAKGLSQFMGVPGRLERVKNSKNINVFVDYAHTDDALKTVLQVLAKIRSERKAKNKIITVFGCGGDRDKGKRPLMTEAAIANSDYVFITSDNPRTEPATEIISDMIKNVSNSLLNTKVFVEIDRREAIRKSIDMAGSNDVILIAGKGHENYQVIGHEKRAFDDVKIAGELLGGM